MYHRGISPEMVQIVGLKVHQLMEQIPIQLGTKGSKSQINHGTKACIKIGTVENYHYFDVINIDRYDIIIGTVFMKQHRIVLDFKKDQVGREEKTSMHYTDNMVKDMTPLPDQDVIRLT